MAEIKPTVLAPASIMKTFSALAFAASLAALFLAPVPTGLAATVLLGAALAPTLWLDYRPRSSLVARRPRAWREIYQTAVARESHRFAA